MVEYSLECLKNLAVDEVSIEEMIDEGTLEVLLNVMKLNPYNERIQQMVNKTISAFCINDRLAAMIAERMGSAGLVFSMKKHVEPETLASTCIAAGKLIKSDAGMEMFVKGGVVAGLKHVVHTQEQNVDVLVPAIACLDRICVSVAHCAEVMESGVVPDVLHALKHYPENATLVGNALSMIARLAAANPAYLEQLKKWSATHESFMACRRDIRWNSLKQALLTPFFLFVLFFCVLCSCLVCVFDFLSFVFQGCRGHHCCRIGDAPRRRASERFGCRGVAFAGQCR
jgi:hypothetical protein